MFVWGGGSFDLPPALCHLDTSKPFNRRDVWGGGGTADNIISKTRKSFGFSLDEKMLPFLVWACIDSLNDVSWSRRVNACATII